MLRFKSLIRMLTYFLLNLIISQLGLGCVKLLLDVNDRGRGALPLLLLVLSKNKASDVINHHDVIGSFSGHRA